MNTKPKEKPLLDPLKLLESLHSIHINFIKDNLPFDKLFSNLLDILLSLTGSEYGFIGRVLKNEKQEKYLKTYAITDISWNEETTKFYKEKAPDGLEFHNLDTLFGWVIKNEKNLITNDAPNHPEASGIPHGHPPLDKFMGIAIKFENKMVGMVGMANRKDGYNERLLRELEPFLSSCSTLINSKIVSEEISAIENKLERFKIALDESALVSITDLKGTITYINNKFVEVSGYSYDELMGQNHRIVNSGYHPREFFVDMWKTIASGKIWNGVIKNRAKDGRFYWVSSTFIPFFDNKGKLYEYLAIRHDITQQKTAEETLAKRNAELDNFATIVSHDLKAPLRGINTMVEFIEDDIPDLSEDVKENFDMLKSRVRRLNGFIDGLLEYSRIGRIDVILEQVDFKNLLELTIDNLSLNEDVEININSTLPVTISSYLLLGQLFSNILSNSVKHCDKEKVVINIECLDKGSFYELHFADNGPGIPEELREKVFHIFQTIKSKDDNDSTGVGLSIVKKIAEELGGSISIQNNATEGINFVFLHPK